MVNSRNDAPRRVFENALWPSSLARVHRQIGGAESPLGFAGDRHLSAPASR